MRYYDQLENKELVRLCELEDTDSLLYILGQRLDVFIGTDPTILDELLEQCDTYSETIDDRELTIDHLEDENELLKSVVFDLEEQVRDLTRSIDNMVF